MKLTAAIKLRVEVMDKLALQQIAKEEGLEMSDVGRRAIRDYIRVRTRAVVPQQSSQSMLSYATR